MGPYGCNNDLPEQIRYTFRNQEIKGGTPSGGGWTGVVYQIAKERLFGTILETDQASLFDILHYMHDQDDRIEKMKRKLKKKRPG